MNKNIYIAVAVFSAITAQAQQDKEKTIGTEEVSITSSYRPTVQDAFKINDNPLLDDQEVSEKKKITYNIFSFPVASTFQPDKGEAASVDKDSLPNYLNNYVLLGYGNYNTLRAEVGVLENIGKNMYAGGLIKHRSSGGGIEEVPVDDGYSRTHMNLVFGNKTEFKEWGINFGANNSKYHWYGLDTSQPELSGLNYNNLDVTQKFQDVSLGGQMRFYRGAIETIDTKYTYFWDAFSSKESRFYFKPKFNIELPKQTVHVNFLADYVNTQFSDDRVGNQNHQYNYLVIAAEPSVKFFKNNYSVELGAGIGYSKGSAQGNSDNTVLIYPKIKANVDLVPDIVQAYLGADGGIQQNSYQQLAEENPFLAPTFALMPTKRAYDLYAGVKGKLYHNISYNVRASYKSEDQKALFTLGSLHPINPGALGYEYANSFDVRYDQVNTLTGFAELTFDLKDVAINFYGEYNTYTLEKEKFAYNLPESRMGLKVHADFTSKIFGDLHVYYVGERKDELRVFNSLSQTYDRSELLLKNYVDLNLKLGYRPNQHWTLFVQGSNLFNQNYYRFTNYQVQGLQVLAGAMYKFDFKKNN